MYIKLLFNIFLGSSVFLIFLTNNWLLIWVWLECVTLSLVTLLQRPGAGPRSVEAVSKYFILQAVASAVVLFGVLVRWQALGAVGFFGGYNPFSYFIILFGLMMKLAVFPNPFWFVDVVSGLSLGRIVYVVVVSKLGPLYLFFLLSGGEVYLLLVVGLFSAFVGSVLGTNQTAVRKIIALSSISNLGWFVVCLPFLGGFLGVLCFLGYVVAIVPVLWLSSFYCYDFLLKGSQLYHGLGGAFWFMSGLLSLGGLPPFIGFFVKWQLFQGLVSVGLFWACGVLVLSSLLSLYFYLSICFNVWSVKWADSRSSSSFCYVQPGSSLFLVLCGFIMIPVTVVGGAFLGPIDSWVGGV